MWKTKNSLKKEILKYFLLFAIVILCILWLFQSILFKSFYKEQRMNDIKLIAEKIKNIKDSSAITDTLNTLALDKSACIEIDNADFTQLYASSYFGKGCITNNQIAYQYKSDFLKKNYNEKIYRLINPNFKNETIVYAMKLGDNQYIFINTSLEPVDGTVILIQKELVAITLLILVFSYILAYFIANHIAEPIKEMNEEAKKLGKGNFNITFNEDSKILEIEELSKTLNYAKGELSKTEELRRDLMANVSHDLKTPLTMIKATAEIAKDLHQKDSKKQEEDMNTIITETDRLTILVNDILSLSKMESVEEQLNLEEFDLVALIEHILKQYKVLTETEKYHFSFEHSEEEILITADQKKLEQVIYNLLNNAINYTGEDNLVTIRVTKNKNILIEIIDTGKGIPEEEIPYIWDKYYKSEKKHKRNLIGTGLGLSIVKKILEQHQFPYGVKSVEGKGSTFYFIIKQKKKK